MIQQFLTCNLRCHRCHLWRNHDRYKKIDQGSDLYMRAIPACARTWRRNNSHRNPTR
jgi:hypothetical protein